MNNDLEIRTGVPAPLTSRRTFIRAASAASGAGILSAGLVPAQESAKRAPPLVLPAATKDVTPFKVHVPQAELDDLKKRLAAARWPDRGPAAAWSAGAPLAKAQALIEYWRTGYAWRGAESSLNALPQLGARVDGLGACFIH